MQALPDLVGRQFARDPGTVYLDTCARGLLPLAARDAVGRLMDDRVAGRVDKEALFATVERARERFAALVGAAADEVAITKNVSEGIAIIAGAVPWRAGDNVVVCLDLEHPNNVYPWLNLQQRLGVEVRAVVPREGHIPADAVVEAIDARTRLVSLSTVSFSPGFRTDVATVGRACRERDVLLLADGVQSVGILDTDVEALGIDAMAVSTQKGLLGLYGFGFLYCRQAWAERLQPAALARFGVDLGQAHEAAMGSGQYRLMPGARRFDLGNYNYAGAAAAAESLGVIAAIGTESIEAHVTRLSHRLAGGLFESGLPVAGGAPGPHLASIVSVGEIGGGHDTTDDPRIGALYRHLAEHGVALTIRRGMLRMALHLYNTDGDVARVLELARDWLKRG
jgi:cysteine desulfurase/selenocysteine lyase